MQGIGADQLPRLAGLILANPRFDPGIAHFSECQGRIRLLIDSVVEDVFSSANTLSLQLLQSTENLLSRTVLRQRAAFI